MYLCQKLHYGKQNLDNFRKTLLLNKRYGATVAQHSTICSLIKGQKARWDHEPGWSLTDAIIIKGDILVS